jgi:hypothetical protein
MYALLQSVWRSQKSALFYWGLILFVLVGWGWLYWNLDPHHSLNICVLKNTTGLPCPACGTTRSLEALLHGEWLTSLVINPLGWLAALGLLVLPLWLMYDGMARQQSLYEWYVFLLQQVQKPRWAIPLAFLIGLNWVWNIWKGL